MSKEKIERNLEIYQDRLKGMSLYQLADKYHIRHTAVIEILRRLKKRIAEKSK